MLSAGKRVHVAGIDKGRRVEILETNNVTEGERVMYNVYIVRIFFLLSIRDALGGEERESGINNHDSLELGRSEYFGL